MTWPTSRLVLCKQIVIEYKKKILVFFPKNIDNGMTALKIGNQQVEHMHVRLLNDIYLLTIWNPYSTVLLIIILLTAQYCGDQHLNTELHTIEILQKKAIRNICNTVYNARTAPLFEQLGIVKFIDLHVYTIQHCKLMYSYTSGNFTYPIANNIYKQLSCT